MGQGQVEGSPQIHTSFFFLKLIPTLVPGRGSAGNSGPDNFDEPPSSDPRGPDPLPPPSTLLPYPQIRPQFPRLPDTQPPCSQIGKSCRSSQSSRCQRPPGWGWLEEAVALAPPAGHGRRCIREKWEAASSWGQGFRAGFLWGLWVGVGGSCLPWGVGGSGKLMSGSETTNQGENVAEPAVFP